MPKSPLWKKKRVKNDFDKRTGRKENINSPNHKSDLKLPSLNNKFKVDFDKNPF